MYKIYNLLAVFLLTASSLFSQPCNITPRPKHIEYGTGFYYLPQKTNYSTNLKGQSGDWLRKILRQDKIQFRETFGKAPIRFRCTQNDLEAESYSLRIDASGIRIEAPSEKGLFYAWQSFLQLLPPPENGQYRLQFCHIQDAPRFSYRGMHLDVSRNFFDKNFIKKQLDVMAQYKLNRFHWHLTDGSGWRIEIPTYPELTHQSAFRPYPNWAAWYQGGRSFCSPEHPQAQGGYYSQEDINEIVQYAADRCIEIIAEIEMPGHSEAALSVYPHLACPGETTEKPNYCSGKEETFVFLENVLSHCAKLFPSSYIHIGGDEVDKTPWSKCPYCIQRMKEQNIKDPDHLQEYFINRMEGVLKKLGKKAIVWDEAIEGKLATETLVMCWRNASMGVQAVSQGQKVIMTPSEFCYLNSYQNAPPLEPLAMGGYIPLRKAYSFDPCMDMISNADKKKVLGLQACLWTEYIDTDSHAEYMLYPRLVALAECGWTDPERKSWPDFYRRALSIAESLKLSGYHSFDLRQEVEERSSADATRGNIAYNKPVHYKNKYHSKYPAAGDSSLTDGLKGGWHYGDLRWQGFLDTDIDLHIDLGVNTSISSIDTEFMQQKTQYVWLPKEVRFLLSEDGKEFRLLQSYSTNISANEERVIFNSYRWEGQATGRYIKLQALNRGIPGGWLFIDEIVVR